MSRIKQTGRSLLRATGMAVLVSAALSLGGEAQAATAEERGFSVPGISYRGQGAPLQRRSQAGMAATVAEFLSQAGWGTETLDSLRVKSEMATNNAGTVVVLDQEVDGLTVYGSRLKAVFDDNGNLRTLGGSMVAVTGSVFMPQIEARDALDVAITTVHPNVSVGLVEIDRVDNTITYGSDPFFYVDPRVTQVAIPERGDSLVEGYLVEIWTDEDNQLHHVLVDGNGKVLEVQNRTADDSYNIFPENPGVDSQVKVSGPGTGNAESPIGWIFTGSHTTHDISGNNVHGYLDTNNDNSPDATGTEVIVNDRALNGNFETDADLFDKPSTFANKNVAAQNLFYLNNLIHDELYRHGFTESAFNFQEDNFERGELGSDSVNAEAQDGGGENNANFATPQRWLEPAHADVPVGIFLSAPRR